jgi:hypothetical protein
MSDITEVQVAKNENELTSFITAVENEKMETKRINRVTLQVSKAGSV